jgi:hypothetical protein
MINYVSISLYRYYFGIRPVRMPVPVWASRTGINNPNSATPPAGLPNASLRLVGPSGDRHHHNNEEGLFNFPAVVTGSQGLTIKAAGSRISN